MKKRYIYLVCLIVGTVVLTLFLSNLYSRKLSKNCFLYESLNKITATEFEEYIVENPDTIVYIGDKTVLSNDKFEKKLINKLKKMNLLKTIVYIEKGEVTGELKNIFRDKYSYEYEEESLPVIIVINDGEIIETAKISKNSDVKDIIDFEVFEW